MSIKEKFDHYHLRIDNIRLTLSNRLALNSNELMKSNFRSLLNDLSTSKWFSSISNQSEFAHRFTNEMTNRISPEIELEQRGMYHYPTRRYCQESKPISSPFQFSRSSIHRKQSVTNLHNWQSILHIDRMRAKQCYDCFPEYKYNTAFGSLLTGLNCINQTEGIGGDEPNVDNKQCSRNISEKIPWEIEDYSNSFTQVCNNSAWNDDYNFQQQSIQDIIKILINFLGEFLLFLSSIIESEQFNCQFQLDKMMHIVERIYQLRSTLLIQINNNNEYMTNSMIFDISSISLILHELASIIHCLGREYQQIDHPQMTMFTQLLDRLEKIVKSCQNSQTCQTSVPIMFPLMNSPCMISNPLASSDCVSPCSLPNMCIPWTVLEQMKNLSETNNSFGLMYGIKDETIRKKMGYSVKEHTTSNRRKQDYKQTQRLNEETKFDRTDGQIPVLQQASAASITQKLNHIAQKEIKMKSGTSLGNRDDLSPGSTRSRLSQKKNSTSRLGSSRTLSRQQSMVNSKQTSELFSHNSDTNEPIRLRSIHDRLLKLNSNGHKSSHVTSPLVDELPIISMPDHSETQRTPSRLVQQQQSNIFKENHHKSTTPSFLSFQTYEHRTPSKMTYKLSRENSQSLSSVHNKSIDTHQSFLSHKNPSYNDVKENKSTSSVARGNDEQNLKGSSNPNPISSKTHITNVNSSVALTPNDKISRNESILNKSWQQRLASPLSMTSIQPINSASVEQKSVRPVSSKQLHINETVSDFDFDDYSEHQSSPSISFLHKETNNQISLLNVIEGPQSAEGSSILETNTKQKQYQLDLNPAITTHRNNTLINLGNADNALSFNKEYLSTVQFSPISENENLPLLTRNEKYQSRFISKRKRKFHGNETTNVLLQSNTLIYFNKFMKCFRQTIVKRVDLL